jgi:hypothetical protein
MHFLNYASFMISQSFIWNGKKRVESKRERERERKK